MKNKAVILSLILVLLMSGCSKSGTSTNSDKDTKTSQSSEENSLGSSSGSGSGESVGETSSSGAGLDLGSGSGETSASTNDYYYNIPTDNSNKVKGDSDTGIEEKKLKQPYNSFGIPIKTKEDIDEPITDEQAEDEQYVIGQDVDSLLGEIPALSAEEQGVIGVVSMDIFNSVEGAPPTETIEDVIETPTAGIIEGMPAGPSEEEIKAFNHKKEAYEINYDVMYEIYQNGILLLDNISSEKEFNRNHRVTLIIVLGKAQKSLEQIENIGNKLETGFSHNTKLIEAWGKLYTELENYRGTLNTIEDAKGLVYNKDKLSSKAFNKLVYNFSKLMEVEIDDYKPEMQLGNTIDNIDNTIEVGES